MGYSGARLEDFVAHVQDVTQRTGRRMAEAGGEAMTSKVVRKMPKRSGELAASVQQKPVVRIADSRGVMLWESGVESHHPRMPITEYGTGIYGSKKRPYQVPKSPEKVVRWTDPDTGKEVFVKRFQHPGQKGRHLFAIAAAETEAEFEQLLAPALEQWQQESERWR